LFPLFYQTKFIWDHLEEQWSQTFCRLFIFIGFVKNECDTTIGNLLDIVMNVKILVVANVLSLENIILKNCCEDRFYNKINNVIIAFALYFVLARNISYWETIADRDCKI
jgi:hypothetical protein